MKQIHFILFFLCYIGLAQNIQKQLTGQQKQSVDQSSIGRKEQQLTNKVYGDYQGDVQDGGQVDKQRKLNVQVSRKQQLIDKDIQINMNNKQSQQIEANKNLKKPNTKQTQNIDPHLNNKQPPNPTHNSLTPSQQNNNPQHQPPSPPPLQPNQPPPHTTHPRNRRPNQQFSFRIHYKMFIYYTISVFVLVGVGYTLTLCYKKYRRYQKEKLNCQLNDKYFQCKSELCQATKGQIGGDLVEKQKVGQKDKNKLNDKQSGQRNSKTKKLNNNIVKISNSKLNLPKNKPKTISPNSIKLNQVKQKTSGQILPTFCPYTPTQQTQPRQPRQPRQPPIQKYLQKLNQSFNHQIQTNNQPIASPCFGQIAINANNL